jgi:hypothetical protein
VTWAADKRATAQQIRQVTGHQSASIQRMMDDHYNATSTEQAQAAIDAVVAKFAEAVSRET